jgi:hypothetical protein
VNEVRERPALTVCVATTAGWPAVAPCLSSFLDDAVGAGAEVIVADGSDNPAPPRWIIDRGVQWEFHRGKSVFALLAINLQRASGEIVALIEDHCTARPGWIDAILRAHAEHPDAVAIGGAIENGTRTSPLEWGSYLMTQSQHMAPLRNGPAARIANEANVSFKREALDAAENHALGYMAIRHTRALAAQGALLINDDRIVVDHHESLGPRATSQIHFDDGRTISAFRRRHMSRGDWARLVAAPLLPIYRTLRVARIGVGKKRGRTVVSSLPWIAWLEYCHAAGEWIGYLLGGGRSPYGLR